jgi:hypothetical protein
MKRGFRGQELNRKFNRRFLEEKRLRIKNRKMFKKKVYVSCINERI